MKIIFALLITFIGISDQAEWGYNDETSWPGECASGIQQSPINIITKNALVDHHQVHIRGPLVFRGYGDVRLKAVNNGHTVRFDHFDEGPKPTLSGGPLRGNYTLLQFHFHWLSEHAVNGMKFPLEVHLVHVKYGLSLEEALSRPDGLAVLGIFFEVVADDRGYHVLEQIMDAMPDLLKNTGADPVPSSIQLSRLLTNDPQSFYTYHGSLTTPQCQEVVTWIVLDKPLLVSDNQYRKFSKVDVGGVDNYRSIQPTNRVVYRSVASCASLLAPSFALFAANLLACSSSSISSAFSNGLCIFMNIKKKLLGHKLKECAK